MPKLALLALQSGDIFYGTNIGANGSCVGEVIFNTAMTGYQEILTDPSYAQQLVILTYPHIGNTGINEIDSESDKIFAKALIIRNYPEKYSNYRSQNDLNDFLKKHQIPAITDVDTRALTQIIRANGALSACLMTVDKVDKKSEKLALAKARKFTGLTGADLAQLVSTEKSYTFNKGSYDLTNQAFKTNKTNYKVAVYDYGVKKNMLRLLVDVGCELKVYPAKTLAIDILKTKPDGVFLSNGPGDPKPCNYAIANIKTLLKQNIPIFGICFGHQLLALASGAKTIKMKFGHHGANHPVQDLTNKRIIITSQNHGFTVYDKSLGDDLRVTHRSLFDNSIQGIAHTKHPAFSFQGHPEASPGPHDLQYLFTQFTQLMQ